jgi:hypothetical protein
MGNKLILSIYNFHQELQSPLRSKWGARPEYYVYGFWNTGDHERLCVLTSETLLSLKMISAKRPAVAFVVSGSDEGKIAMLNPVNSSCDDNDFLNSTPNSSNSSSASSAIILSPSSSTDSLSTSSSSASASGAPSNKRIGGALLLRVGRMESSLVSVSYVRSVGILSLACLGLTDKFNGTKAILQTSITKRNDSHIIYEARLSHRSSSCGFWIKARESSSIVKRLTPKEVALDNQMLRRGLDWNWYEDTGILKVNMTAVPLNTMDNDTSFCIQIHLL